MRLERVKWQKLRALNQVCTFPSELHLKKHLIKELWLILYVEKNQSADYL